MVKADKNIIERYTSSWHRIRLEIESKLTKEQKQNLLAVFNNSGNSIYGSDIKKYLVDNLKICFEKAGSGGNHVWISDRFNNRLAIIKIYKS